MLAFGENFRDRTERLGGDPPILLRQEIHRKMDAVEVAPWNGQIAAGFGAARQRHGVILGEQLARIDRALGSAADMDAVMERHALGLHLRHAAVDDMLFHLEVRDAVTEQAAGLGEFFVDMDVVAGARELLRGRKPRRSGANDRDLLAGPGRRNLRLQPAIFPGAIHNGAFDGLDGDRVVVDVEGAGGLARGGADAAGELGEIVGRVQVARGFFPVALIDEVVEIGDLVVDRAARRARRHRTGAVAIGNAAIHAARSLILGVLLAQRNDEFAVVLHALGDRRVLAFIAVDLEKTCDLAHKT